MTLVNSISHTSFSKLAQARSHASVKTVRPRSEHQIDKHRCELTNLSCPSQKHVTLSPATVLYTVCNMHFTDGRFTNASAETPPTSAVK